jgi:hypothetical protein
MGTQPGCVPWPWHIVPTVTENHKQLATVQSCIVNRTGPRQEQEAVARNQARRASVAAISVDLEMASMAAAAKLERDSWLCAWCDCGIDAAGDQAAGPDGPASLCVPSHY